MSKTYYMHTLNGKPAQFTEYGAICYASRFGPANPLAKSLRQIREEQAQSMSNDILKRLSDTPEYGYVRVRTP